jgi:hypothetical protein
LQGGPLDHGPNRNELLLSRVYGSNDFAKLAVDVTNYMSESSFTNRLFTWKEKRFLGLQSDLFIFLLTQTMIPIVLIV